MESKKPASTHRETTLAPTHSANTLTNKVTSLLENDVYIVLKSALVVYILFSDEIRLVTSDKSVDDYFFLASYVSLGLFSLDIIMNSLSKPGYFLRYPFWLDILFTASIAFNIDWLYETIVGTDKCYGSAHCREPIESKKSIRHRAIFAASRVTKSPITCPIVIVFVKMIRIAKLYKTFQSAVDSKKLKEHYYNIEDSGHNKLEAAVKGNAEKKMSPSIVKAVIFSVVAIILASPIFHAEQYSSCAGDIEEYYPLFSNETTREDTYYSRLNHIHDHSKESRNPVLEICIGGKIEYSTIDLDSLRDFEKSSYNYILSTNDEPKDNYLVIDCRDQVQLDAVLSILETVVILIILTVPDLYYSRKSNALTIAPIKDLYVKAKDFAYAPEIAAEIDDEDEDEEEDLDDPDDEQEMDFNKISKGFIGI